MSTDPTHVDTGAEVAGTEADKINTGALGTLVAVGLFAMISITAAVTALVRHDIEFEESEKAADANQVVTDLKADQRKALNGPAGYVDRGKGLVSLPIDLAKGLVVSELEHDPNSATPPPPAKPDAGTTEAAGAAAIDSAKPEEKKAPAGKPEPSHDVKTPAPGSSATPTTPGAESPTPTKK